MTKGKAISIKLIKDFRGIYIRSKQLIVTIQDAFQLNFQLILVNTIAVFIIRGVT